MIALSVVVALTCASEPSHVGVAELSSSPALTALSSALAGVVSNELQRMGAFKVTSAGQVREQLSLDRQKQLLGCADEACSAATLDLGFDYLVTGSVTKFEGRDAQPYTLELVLLNQKSRSREASEVVKGSDEADLLTKVSPAVARLVAVVLKERSGQLVVRSSEDGAVLKVDDVVVGTTPLTGRLEAAGGPHYLKLEKDGFVAWQKEVRITAGALTEESVRLVPSPDFVAAYESKQTKLRVGAWLTTAVAVASIAAAIAFEARTASLYGSGDADGSFVQLRGRVAAGDETKRSQLLQLRQEIQSYQLLTGAFTGIAAAAGVAAAVFWVMGEDPHRYDAYRETGLKVSLGAGPHGGFAVLSGGF